MDPHVDNQSDPNVDPMCGRTRTMKMRMNVSYANYHCQGPATDRPGNWRTCLHCVVRRARAALVGFTPTANSDQRRFQRFGFMVFSLTLAVLLMLLVLRGKDYPRGFPTLNDTDTSGDFNPIPLRIHQMYRDDNIPNVYRPFVKSWIKNHPKWEYWFWTDESIRDLLKDHYPQFLDMYDGYSNNLLRSDAARYFILYHFGGVYADMDMESFRPLEPILSKHTCIFSREPTVQSSLLYDMTSVSMNAWMACSKRHKVMKYVINNLPQYDKPIRTIFQTIYITGPHMLHKTLLQYNTTQNCTREETNCAVFIAPYEMFMPAWDDGQRGHFHEMCSINLQNLSLQQLLACAWLRKTNFSNTVPTDIPYIYANHKFLHIGYKNGHYWNKKKPIHISKLVPNALRYVRGPANSTEDNRTHW